MDQDKTSYLNRSGYPAGGDGTYRGAHAASAGGKGAVYRGAHSAPADATRRVAYPETAMGEAPEGYAAGAGEIPAGFASGADATRVADASRRVGAMSAGYAAGADATRRVDQSGLPQDPIYAPQETAYMLRAAMPQQPYTPQPQRPYAAQPAAGQRGFGQKGYAQSAYPQQDLYSQRSPYPQQGGYDPYARPEPARAAAAPAGRYRGSALAKTMIGILVALFVVSFGYSLINGLLGNGAAALGNAVSGLTQGGQASSNASVSTDDIVGQYWSNAKTILESRGANVSDMLVLTDDGSKPVLDSNWVVSQVYTNSDGKLEVQLTRATNAGDAVSGIVDGLGQKATDIWNSLQGATGGVSAAG